MESLVLMILAGVVALAIALVIMRWLASWAWRTNEIVEHMATMTHQLESILAELRKAKQ